MSEKRFHTDFLIDILVLEKDGTTEKTIKNNEIDAIIFKLRAADKLCEAAKDTLDAYWDMSPLEYANSRGLPFMSDEEGDRIRERLRKTIAAVEAERGKK